MKASFQVSGLRDLHDLPFLVLNTTFLSTCAPLKEKEEGGKAVSGADFIAMYLV